MDDGPPGFGQGFPCPVLLRNSSGRARRLRLQGRCLLRRTFPDPSPDAARSLARLLLPPAPKGRVWAVPLSLAATGGISVDFLSCGYWDGSVPRVRLRRLWIRRRMAGHSPAGFPHSEIPESMTARVSSGLIAAVRVLPRFPKPRHPPCAHIRPAERGSARPGARRTARSGSGRDKKKQDGNRIRTSTNGAPLWGRAKGAIGPKAGRGPNSLPSFERR